jgi:hypothetical protein
MTEEKAKYEHAFEGSDNAKSYLKKLDDFINIDLAVSDRHLDISYDYIKHLPSVEELENERKDLGEKDLWNPESSPDAYNEKISAVIQKAIKLIAKLKSLQLPEYKYQAL